MMSEDIDMGKDRVIDLAAKKTESEWAYTAQTFFEQLTTLWFRWLGWIFAIGGVAYLSEKTGSTPLKFIKEISYSTLTFYFLFFFASLRLEPYHSWALSRPTKFTRILALLPFLALSLALIWGSRELIDHLIEQVKVAK